MNGRPQVSIRLGTTGKSEVQRDFAEIGDAGSTQAQRYAAAWERASAEAERALEKQAKAAQRMASVAPTSSGATNRVNPTTGAGYDERNNDARKSAAALAAELDRAEREANQLIAAIDPLFGAQQRYATNVARIEELKKLGVLQGARYAQALEAEEQALDTATAAALRNNQVRGATRAGMQQLSFQAGDVAQQLALGTNAGIIFAQQSGQVVQAMQMMGGEGNKVLKWLGGPWGLAVSTAAVVLLPLIGNLLKTGDQTADLVDKMRDQEKTARAQEGANKIWSNSVEGVTAALRDNRKALDDLNDSGKTAARRALEVALAEAEKAKRLRETTVAILEQAQAEFKAAQGFTFGAAGGAGAGAAQGIAAQQVEEAQRLVNEAKAAAAEADKQVQEATRRRVTELYADDPVEKIRRQYDDPRTGLIALAGQAASAEDLVNGKLKARVDLLKQERDAKIKAQQDKDRDPPKNAGGTAIFDAQIASFFDTAVKYRGLGESKDKSVLQALFSEANMALDPEKTAWCAAFVNAVLAANGVSGSGSLAAGSFLNFGKDDTRSPQKGDVVVVKSGGSPSGQHVGFLESVDAKGNVKVLGGNTGDKVGSATYSKDQILAIRRPPTPSEAARSTETAADKALKAQNDFEEQLARLQAQLLQAVGENVLGAQARARFAADQIKAEEDRTKQQIQNNLEEGKYGDATSKLAQERAKQLTDAATQTAEQKRITLATANLARSLQDGDQRLAQLAQFHVDELQHQESIARTAGEQRKLQLEIIDALYEEKQRHLEVARNLALMAGEYADAARIQDQLNNLPAEKARDQDNARRQTRSPGEVYLESLPQTMADLNEQLQKIEVKGIEALSDGLLDAAMNAKSLGDFFGSLDDLFHNVAQQILADLLRMFIQMQIMRPLAQMLFGGQQGGAVPGGGGSSGGNIWSTIIGGIASAAGAIFGGGAPGLGGPSSNYGSNPTTGPMGMATGTAYHPGGLTWVGENGKELLDVPTGAKIYSAAESRRLAAANDGGMRVPPLIFNNDFRGADAAAVATIQSRLDQMEADLPSRVVSTMQDARQRFLWR